MKAGLVDVVRLGHRYRFFRDDRRDRYCFAYTDRNGQKRLDTYRFVVNARGQPRSLKTDPSELARNLLAAIRARSAAEPDHRAALAGQPAAVGAPAGTSDAKRADTLRIDPRTHRVVRPDFGPRSAVYAVGAMTRGQIIDASMAHALACATATIADNLLHSLSRR
jgi:hypothetical protein